MTTTYTLSAKEVEEILKAHMNNKFNTKVTKVSFQINDISDERYAGHNYAFTSVQIEVKDDNR